MASVAPTSSFDMKSMIASLKNNFKSNFDVPFNFKSNVSSCSTITNHHDSRKNKRTFDMTDLLEKIDLPSYKETHIYPAAQNFMKWCNKIYCYNFTKKTQGWLNELKAKFGTVKITFPKEKLAEYTKHTPSHLHHIADNLKDSLYQIHGDMIMVKITIDEKQLFDFLVERKILVYCGYNTRRTYILQRNFNTNEIKFIDRDPIKKRSRINRYLKQT